MAHVYGPALATQMLNGMGGNCATETDAKIAPSLSNDPPPMWNTHTDTTINTLVIWDTATTADASRDAS